MATQSPPANDNSRKKADCAKCEEKDTPTQKSIATLRKTYCTELTTDKGNKKSAEITCDGLYEVYQEKKYLFTSTEKNYRIYRNMEICLGAQLISSNDCIKTNVANYVQMSTDLATKLKAIVTAIKNVKAKVSDLRDQASNLENYKNDNCNATQWSLLTGKNMDNCKGEQPPQHHRPEACKDAEHIYHELIVIPKKALIFDIDSIFKASSDIVGIQVFSNIATLTPLQQNLATASKNLDTLIQTAMTTRSTELTALQADLIKSVQNCTTATADKHTKASDCDAAHHTVEFLCCPDCECVPEECDHDRPRLHDCECKICNICCEVRNTYRTEPRKPGEKDCGCP